MPQERVSSRLATGKGFRRGCASLYPTGIAPNITRGPQDSTVIDGMSVILNCETSGAPRPAITWQKGKGAEGTGVRASMATRASSASSTATWLSGHQAWPMAEAPFADGVPPCHPGERILASGSVQLPRFTLLESGSLLVSPAHLADAGTYACLATNSRGVDEASADLVVWGKAPASVPASPGSACRPVCLHGAGWTLTSSVGSWVLVFRRAWCGMELSGGAEDGLWHVAGWVAWVQTWAVPCRCHPGSPPGANASSHVSVPPNP